MVKAVIFDIGNVLIEWQPERHYDAIIGETARRAMFSQVDLHGMNDTVDRGGDLATEARKYAAAHPQWHDEILRWHSDWHMMASPEIPHSVRLLRALRTKGVPVFALTNFGTGTFATAQKTYPFLQEFDKFYVSGAMKVIKPDTKIYQMVEADCAIDPAQLLFTDDRADNIAAAAQRGWNTHLFEGPAGWAARMVAEGLLTHSEAQ
ncbi:haloacid dehalogenase [Thioclava sp. SK-1]|uniref:HAD family hydrolase n=1 Tax=Thioclava sp. SK-1 TaxID=1889770 RepID=UPI000824C9ED|nr:HAD family phosphatase [Thioclava sp. SK-1]OCX61111.1 haloacid dehalogenase [Thioclava sp. SK-1]